MTATDQSWRSVRSLRGKFEFGENDWTPGSICSQSFDSSEESSRSKIHEPHGERQFQSLPKVRNVNKSKKSAENKSNNSDGESPVLDFRQRKLAFQRAVDVKIEEVISNTSKPVTAKSNVYRKQLSSTSSSSLSSPRSRSECDSPDTVTKSMKSTDPQFGSSRSLSSISNCSSTLSGTFSDKLKKQNSEDGEIKSDSSKNTNSHSLNNENEPVDDVKLRKIKGRRNVEPHIQNGRSKSVGAVLKEHNNGMEGIKSNEFQSKQKLLESVITKRRPLSGEIHNKSNSKYKKSYFTSKQDKDFLNKRTKADMSDRSRGGSSNDFESIFNGKTKISKIIPKISPNQLKLPLSKLKDSTVLANAKYRMKESSPSRNSHLFDNKPKPLKRKTMPEADLIKIREAIQLNKARNIKSAEVESSSQDQNLSIKPIKPSELYKMKHREPSPKPVEMVENKTCYEQQMSSPLPVRPPRRHNSISPRKKHRAPQPPSNSDVKNKSTDEVDSITISTESKSPNLKHVAPDIDCPKEDSQKRVSPPKKPPRTFAYEIYTDSKVRKLSRSSSSCTSSLNDSSSVSAITHPQPPLYAVVNKNVPKDKQIDTSSVSTPKTDCTASKPVIAPKPSNLKILARKQSLVEQLPPIESRILDHQPISPSDCPDDEPTYEELTYPCQSLQPIVSTHSTIEESPLNRKRSMSDETLVSTTNFRPVEPIYAIPFMKTPLYANKVNSSNQELHYMCSELYPEDNTSPDSFHDVRKSQPNLLNAWKREFRQSCRHVQDRIKRTVTTR